METLVYFHLALEYEARRDSRARESFVEGSKAANSLGEGSTGLPLANRFWPSSLLKVTAAIALSGWAQPALAQLQPGDRNPNVREAQARLQQLGYFQAKTTGYYGAITKASVQRFQRDRGLTADGILGPQTHSLLLGSADSETKAAEAYLGEGSQGTAVRALQQQLQVLGFYRGAVTGTFDAATKDAVMRFQRARGLNPDGVVGPRTLAALGPARSPAPSAPQIAPLAFGRQGTPVRSLQQRLSALGYYRGEINGNFDSATREAVMNFQLERGLQPDGIVGAQTFSALGSAAPRTPAAATPAPAPVSSSPTVLSRERVQELQQRLQELGFYRGPIDGLWGAQTQTALEEAQRFYGVSRDDIISGR